MSLKILHVIDSGGLYGAEMVLLALAEEQKHSGHIPCIASIGEPGEYEKPLEKEARRRGIDVEVFRMRNGPNILGAFNIVRFARAEGFNIIHSHGYKGNILLGFIPRRVRAVPLVSTVHGWTSVDGLSKMRLYEWADGISLRFMDAVCVVSGSMMSHPRLCGIDPAKIHVVPNGIPRLDLAEQPPEDDISRFCRSGYTIASIGRLSPEKGYDILLKAFARFHSSHPDSRLVIIGEGPERAGLESMVKSFGLEGDVILPGYREKAWRNLRFCKVFVLSSLTEGLPVTLLEALQTGIVVVATDVGEIPRIIEHGKTGFIVPVGDASALCSTFEIVCKDNMPFKDNAEGCCSIGTTWDSKKMWERYWAIYRSLERVI